MIHARINIPNRPAHDAAGIVIARLRELGIDPRKAITNPMMRAICTEYAHGRYTDADFEKACRNMLVMNPGLGAQSKGHQPKPVA